MRVGYLKLEAEARKLYQINPRVLFFLSSADLSSKTGAKLKITVGVDWLLVFRPFFTRQF